MPVHGRSVRLQSSVLRFELQALQLAKFLLHFIASKTFDAENPPIGTYDLSVLHKDDYAEKNESTDSSSPQRNLSGTIYTRATH